MNQNNSKTQEKPQIKQKANREICLWSFYAHLLPPTQRRQQQNNGRKTRQKFFPSFSLDFTT